MIRFKLFFFIVICCWGSNMSFAQGDLRQADELYEQFDFAGAADLYKKVLDDDKKNMQALERIADCYRQLGNNQKATYWYPKAIKANTKNDLLKYYYARCLMGLSKYGEALEWFRAYQQTTKGSLDLRTESFIDACKNIAQFYADSASYQIKRANFSSPQGDLAPTFWQHENKLAFSSFRPKKAVSREETYADIFYTEKISNIWSLPQPIPGKSNNPYHEGPVTFNSAGNVMYFTRNVPRKKARHSGVAHLQIFESRWEKDHWTEGEVLSFCDENYSFGHPALSADSKTLYFVSDMPMGSEGGKDIWKSEWVSGRWTDPVNLGASVNTRGDEMFPSIHADGSLYFSSDGRSGIGGFDVFMATPYGEDWNVENLKYPINTPKDELAIILSANKTTAYLTSNRLGNEDIYIVTMPASFHLKEAMFAQEDTRTPSHFTDYATPAANSNSSTQYIPITPAEPIVVEKVMPAEVVENYTRFTEMDRVPYSITGIVVDEVTHQGVSGAQVRIVDTKNPKITIDQITNDSGSFSFWVEAGKNYTVSKIDGSRVEDYKIVNTVAANGKTNANIILISKIKKQDALTTTPEHNSVKSLYDEDKHANTDNLTADVTYKAGTNVLKNTSAVVYRVQIGAFQQAIPSKNAFFSRVKDRSITTEIAPSGLVRYTTGNYEDFSIAQTICSEMKRRGYRNAFVAGYIDGTRYEGDILEYQKK